MTKKTTTRTRAATPQDVAGIIRVVTSATQERFWMKYVPLRIQSKEDELEALITERIDPSNQGYVVEVVDAEGKKGVSEIAAVAFWDVSAALEDGKTRKDANLPPKGARLNAYHQVVQQAKTQFDSRYPQYKYLQLLVTHANHQQQGYGKDLVESFISKARQTGGVLTALGGPSGYIFFSGLGFHDLGPVSIPEGMSTDTQLVKMLSLVVEKERRRSLSESIMHYLSS